MALWNPYSPRWTTRHYVFFLVMGLVILLVGVAAVLSVAGARAPVGGVPAQAQPRPSDTSVTAAPAVPPDIGPVTAEAGGGAAAISSPASTGGSGTAEGVSTPGAVAQEPGGVTGSSAPTASGSGGSTAGGTQAAAPPAAPPARGQGQGGPNVPLTPPSLPPLPTLPPGAGPPPSLPPGLRK
jgi:hypothetical protein